MLAIYPWQQDQWQRLQEMQQHQRLPHALLLCGPEGIGLKQFALSVSMQMRCENKSNAKACGICQSCQLFLAGNHPDISYIEPEETGKQIKIAQIRELIGYVSLKSFSGDTKIAIIEPADAMNRATANALLKTLEEPPEQSILILLSHQPSRLPITIRSRCQRIDFYPDYEQSTCDWVQQHINEHDISAALLLRLSQGAPLKALELMEDEQLSQRQVLVKDLQQLSQNQADIVQMAASWQEQGCEIVLKCLMNLIQDLIRLKLLNDKAILLNVDIKEDLQELVKTLDLLQMVRNYDFVQLKYQEFTGPMNYNPLSILEQVLVRWSDPEIVA